MVWSETTIARAIALQTLARKCLVLVDNCSWTGNECDVLGVTMDLRIIDVEVKISRSDLKADAKKDKWWQQLTWREEGPARRLEHPRKVWKHYYALPLSIWKPELLACLPSPASGVLLLDDRHGRITVSCERRAMPAKDAYRLTPAEVMDVARLQNLRMWDAYQKADNDRAALLRSREREAA